METLRLLLVVLHILGLAVIIGPFLFQVSRKADFDTRLMRIGAIAQLVTGLALVGVREADDLPVDNAKIGVKLVVAVLVLVAVWMAGREQNAVAGGGPAKAALPWFHTAGALAIVNVLVAVLWT
jgi:hypothetical protein